LYAGISWILVADEQKTVILEIMKAVDAIIANGEEFDGQKKL
jgi:hypothetical protein